MNADSGLPITAGTMPSPEMTSPALPPGSNASIAAATSANPLLLVLAVQNFPTGDVLTRTAVWSKDSVTTGSVS